VHSVTKYIGGHSDLLAGVMVGPTPLVEQARARAVRFGTTLGPFEAWLALRGTRTLALRMERHSRNAAALADALSALQAVERVHYPSQEVAARTLGGGCGGMLAFDLAGGRDSVQQMVARLRMVRFAASLGGVETTISYPEITSHRGLTPEQRSARGIKPGTVRVSVGIEDAEDIVEDFRQAIG
jgi:cystathionine gamma-synthase